MILTGVYNNFFLHTYPGLFFRRMLSNGRNRQKERVPRVIIVNSHNISLGGGGGWGEALPHITTLNMCAVILTYKLISRRVYFDVQP